MAKRPTRKTTVALKSNVAPSVSATPADVQAAVANMKPLNTENKESRVPAPKSLPKRPAKREIDEKLVLKNTAAAAYEKLREDMIEQHIKVTTLYHVQGPKGFLFVYNDGERWQVTKSLKDQPLAGSKLQERALTWAQNQLV